MENPFKYFLLLISLVLFTQCRNVIIGEDSLPGAPKLNFQDQNIDIGRGEVTVLNIKDWVSVSGEVLIHVRNTEELTGRFVITKDGFLAYQAPSDKEEEGIVLELEDEQGNTFDGRIDFQILNMPVLNTCNGGPGVDFVNVFMEPLMVSTMEFTSNNTACGLPPTNDFEIIFPTRELVVELEDGILTIEPNPGGISTDWLSYLGKLEDGTPYMESILIANTLGCFERANEDNFELIYDAGASSYDLMVLNNDEFCTFTKEDTEILEVTGIINGEVEIIDQQFLRYTSPSSPSLPITENFVCTVRFKILTGYRVMESQVALTINP